MNKIQLRLVSVYTILFTILLILSRFDKAKQDIYFALMFVLSALLIIVIPFVFMKKRNLFVIILFCFIGFVHLMSAVMVLL